MGYTLGLYRMRWDYEYGFMLEVSIIILLVELLIEIISII